MGTRSITTIYKGKKQVAHFHSWRDGHPRQYGEQIKQFLLLCKMPKKSPDIQNWIDEFQGKMNETIELDRIEKQHPIDFGFEYIIQLTGSKASITVNEHDWGHITELYKGPVAKLQMHQLDY